MNCSECRFYANSQYLRCTPFPVGDPAECRDFEVRASPVPPGGTYGVSEDRILAVSRQIRNSTGEWPVLWVTLEEIRRQDEEDFPHHPESLSPEARQALQAIRMAGLQRMGEELGEAPRASPEPLPRRQSPVVRWWYRMGRLIRNALRGEDD